MFDYPKQAEFNRIVPKSKIYNFAKPNRAVRDRFVSQVAEIVWAYKLSPETINLPSKQGIHEIQVFVIALKNGELSEEVLRTIDKAIPSPIFFDVTFAGRIKSTAAYKRSSDADPSKSIVEGYFETPWQPMTTARPSLPVALDLAGLYEQMLRLHMPISARTGETMKSHVERATQIRSKEYECQKLEVRLKREVQFNRKVELNAALRRNKTEIAKLSASKET